MILKHKVLVLKQLLLNFVASTTVTQKPGLDPTMKRKASKDVQRWTLSLLSVLHISLHLRLGLWRPEHSRK